jgi:hypothetical protein
VECVVAGTHRILHVNLGAFVEQEVNDCGIPGDAAPVQCCETIFVARVDCNAGGQQAVKLWQISREGGI